MATNRQSGDLPDKLSKLLEQLEHESTKQVASLSEEINETLWHYTTTAGALGILKSSTLWMTERQHSNDPTEIRLGLELANEIIESLPSGKTGDAFRKFIVPRLNSAADSQYFFIGSFSREKESLPQWRSYADDGRGFALGFKSDLFDTAPNNWKGDWLLKYSIYYDRSRLRNLQEAIIKVAVDVTEQGRRFVKSNASYDINGIEFRTFKNRVRRTLVDRI